MRAGKLQVTGSLEGWQEILGTLSPVKPFSLSCFLVSDQLAAWRPVGPPARTGSGHQALGAVREKYGNHFNR